MKNFFCILFLSAILTNVFAQSPKEMGGIAANNGKYAEAYSLWLPLAEKGDPEVQEAIALLLESQVDIGITLTSSDRSKFIRYWIVRSAMQGHKSAVLWLSDSLAHGWHGFEKSEKGAACWKGVASGTSNKSDCEKLL